MTAPRWFVLLAFVLLFAVVGGLRWMRGDWRPRGWRLWLLIVAGLLLVQFLVTSY
jgi:hypothetical protein